MDLEKIPAGHNAPWDVNVVIEIPRGGPPVKYEFNKSSKAMFVDRFLSTAMFYPCHYGFIPNTLSDDGDPIDAFVEASHAVVPGCVIRARPVGVLLMEDESGVDEKLMCVPHDKLSSFYKNVKTYRDLPEVLCRQVQHFFEHYKDLEPNKWVKVQGWAEPERAAELIEAAIARYRAPAAK
jgi:inorganic pyrophosphatase